MPTGATELDEVVVYLKASDFTAFQRFYRESQQGSGKVWPFLRRQIIWLVVTDVSADRVRPPADSSDAITRDPT